METKLTEAKKRVLNGDFTEQEQIIINLKKVREFLITIEQNNLILLKKTHEVELMG